MIPDYAPIQRKLHIHAKVSKIEYEERMRRSIGRESWLLAPLLIKSESETGRRGRSVTVAVHRVCRSSIGPLSLPLPLPLSLPRPLPLPLPLSWVSFHPIRRRHHHRPIPIRSVCASALGWGLEGRRHEADKRIALSSQNDIFDQHFHTAPARGVRSSRAHHSGASKRTRDRGFCLPATTLFALQRNLL